MAQIQTVFVLQGGDVVDIVLNNLDTGRHPFHLHGHVFQLIKRHKEIPDTEDPVSYNVSDHAEWPEYPMSRDTVYVKPQSYIVMRFKADNPGVWFSIAILNGTWIKVWLLC